MGPMHTVTLREEEQSFRTSAFKNLAEIAIVIYRLLSNPTANVGSEADFAIAVVTMVSVQLSLIYFV